MRLPLLLLLLSTHQIFCASPAFAAETLFKSPEGFIPLQEGFRPIPVLNAHQVWFTPDLSMRIFITFNLPDGKTAYPEGSLFPLNASDHMIYLRDQNHRRFSLIFDSVPKERAETLARDLEKRIQKSPPVLEAVSRILLPQATAATASCPTNGAGGTGLPDFYSMFVNLANELGPYVSAAWGCFKGQLQGIWDATGGTVISIAEGAYQLVVHPIDSWNSMKAAFNRFVEFVTHFRKSMVKIGNAIAELPIEDQAELLCSFISSIQTDIAIAILTAGAGSPLVAKELAAFTKRILGIEKFISRISKLGPLKKILGGKFMSRLARGTLSAERLETLEVLTNNGFVEIAKEAALCGL